MMDAENCDTPMVVCGHHASAVASGGPATVITRLDGSAMKRRRSNDGKDDDDDMWPSVRRSPSRTTWQTRSEDNSSPHLHINRSVFEYSDPVEIGDGDFGNVTAATYDLDGQRYAIKAWKKVALGAYDLQHQLQEVYALSSISGCPFLVRYYDAWIEDWRVHIKTELLAGGCVRHVPHWDEPSLWKLFLQLSLGLHTMHSADVAHLDIKPDNILCGGDDALGNATTTFKIADFGLARPLRGSIIGEQYRGLNDDEGDCRYLCPVFFASGGTLYLKEADIFALGCTLFELAGGNPLCLRTEQSLGRVDRSRFPSSEALNVLEQFSESFRELVLQMTDPDPTLRPTAFQVVQRTIAGNSPGLPDGCQELVDSYEREISQLEDELQGLELDEADESF